MRRFLEWIGDRIDHFLSQLFGSGSGGGVSQWWAVLALLVILAVVLIVILRKFGPIRRTAKADRLLFDESAPLDAAGYRKSSESFAARGEWAEAVRARLRAIIAGLEERTVLEPRPGRTADVAAREAGLAMPAQAQALGEAARVFDDIWYGEADARAEDYQRLKIIDEAVAATRARYEPAPAADARTDA